MRNILSKLSEKHWAIIIFIFAFAIYSNTIFNEYNLDDNLVTQNHKLTSKGIAAIPEIFKSYYYEDEMGYQYGYRPITHVSFALEHSLFGERASVSHAINVFLYAITCLLIFFFVRKLKPASSYYFAVLVAILFAVHPIHTEVVASIKNRDEILSLLFGLLALIFAMSIKPKESGIKKVIKWFFVLGIFCLSILSKNATVLFSIIIPMTYLIFIDHKKLLFPLLFSIAATSLNAYFLSIQTNEIVLLFTSTCALMLFIYFLFSENRNWLKQKQLEFLQTKDIINSILLVSVVVLGSAFFLKIYYLFIAVFLLLIWSLVFVKKQQDVFKISGFAFICTSLMSVLLENQNLLIVAYLFLIVINTEYIQQKKWQWFSVVLYVIFSSSFINQFGTPTGIEILFIGLYFSNIYFKPLLLIVPIVILSEFNKDIPVIVSSLLGFAILLYYLYQKRLSKEALLPTKRIISVGFVLMLVFSLVSKGNLRNTASYNITEVTSVIEENRVDRPVLFLENPLIENWNYEHRIPTAIITVKFYLQKLILPYPLLFYYGYDKMQIANFNSFEFYIGLVIIIILLLVAFYNFKKRKLLSFGIVFMLVNLVPYSNLMTPIAGIVAERLAYVSSLGFVMLIAAFFMWTYLKFKCNVCSCIFIILFLFFSFSYVVYRNSLWKNRTILFENDLKYLTNSAVANSLYGEFLLNEAEKITDLKSLSRKKILDKSILKFRNSINIYDEYLNNFHYLGKAYYMIGEFSEAQSAFVQSYALDSSYLSEPYLYMADWAKQIRQDSIAVYDYLKYLELEPYDEQSHFKLLEVLFNNKRNMEANSILLAMDEKFPNQVLIHYNLFELNSKMKYDSIANFYYNKGMKTNELQFRALLAN